MMLCIKHFGRLRPVALRALSDKAVAASQSSTKLSSSTEDECKALASHEVRAKAPQSHDDQAKALPIDINSHITTEHKPKEYWSGKGFSQILRQRDLDPQEQEETKAKAFLWLASQQDDPSSANVDWDLAMRAVRESEAAYPPHRFTTEEREDLQHSTVTFNAAKVVEASPALKRLVDLGVDLSTWDKKGWAELVLRAAQDGTIQRKMAYLAGFLHPGTVRFVSFWNCPHVTFLQMILHTC